MSRFELLSFMNRCLTSHINKALAHYRCIIISAENESLWPVVSTGIKLNFKIYVVPASREERMRPS